MPSNPERLRKQAQSISSRSKDPKQAWKELREWASGLGPLAMDIAVHEFLIAHGRDPSAASLMPQVMHGMAMLPLKERIDLPRKQEPELSPSLSMLPKSNLALTKERPAAIGPIYAMGAPIDPVSMRDMPLRMHEGMKRSFALQSKPNAEPKTRNTIAASNTGHQILHSLIRHISSHGRSDAPTPRKKTSKRRAPPRKKRTVVKAKPKAGKRSKPKPRAISRPKPKPAKKRAKTKRKPAPLSRKKPVKKKPQKRGKSRKR